VVITDELDTDLDLSTLQLTAIGFNDVVLDVPPGLDHFEGDVQVHSDPNPVRVLASLHPVTRIITWTLTSEDPVTGDLPEDPLAGFLPPNDDQAYGEGFVSFIVRPLVGLPDGTQITNQARIMLDVNPPIDTNVVTNTLGVPEWIHLPFVLKYHDGSQEPCGASKRSRCSYRSPADRRHSAGAH
jgi:hypothetical protein